MLSQKKKFIYINGNDFSTFYIEYEGITNAHNTAPKTITATEIANPARPWHSAVTSRPVSRIPSSVSSFGTRKIIAGGDSSGGVGSRAGEHRRRGNAREMYITPPPEHECIHCANDVSGITNDRPIPQVSHKSRMRPNNSR